MAGEAQASRNAEGFFFLNAEDAAMALKEKKQIEYLEKHLDYRNPEQVLTLYERMLRERLFKTPVGMIYLKQLQGFLLDKSEIDPARVPMIPVYVPCASIPVKRERPARKGGEKPRTEKQRTVWPRISVILNVLLVAAIIVMFFMTLVSDSPNVLNYRTAILNEYSSWQQELVERERIVREKERELKIVIE
ncbi:MAG: hypothetical protein NC543_00065 [bacterium]|nr:hypothetical protein [bacterium]MCM1376033.1 hypothetical protein [Muribaculum sp.]